MIRKDGGYEQPADFHKSRKDLGESHHHKVCFSILVLNVLKTYKASDFFFKKYTQVFLLKSFVKVTKYLDPENDGVENKPQRAV